MLRSHKRIMEVLRHLQVLTTHLSYGAFLLEETEVQELKLSGISSSSFSIKALIRWPCSHCMRCSSLYKSVSYYYHYFGEKENVA